MKRTLMGTALLAGIMGFAALDGFAKQEMTGGQIMKKLNGKTGVHKKVGEALKASPVKWDAVATDAKTYLELAEKFTKTEPEKGEKESFDKLTKKYAEDAKALSEAATKKDAKAATEAFGKLGKSCKGCHDAHKGA